MNPRPCPMARTALIAKKVLSVMYPLFTSGGHQEAHIQASHNSLGIAISLDTCPGGHSVRPAGRNGQGEATLIELPPMCGPGPSGPPAKRRQVIAIAGGPAERRIELIGHRTIGLKCRPRLGRGTFRVRSVTRTAGLLTPPGHDQQPSSRFRASKLLDHRDAPCGDCRW